MCVCAGGGGYGEVLAGRVGVYKGKQESSFEGCDVSSQGVLTGSCRTLSRMHPKNN